MKAMGKHQDDPMATGNFSSQYTNLQYTPPMPYGEMVW